MRPLLFVLVLCGSAAAARPPAPASAHRAVQNDMEQTIRMGTTPSFQILPHSSKIKLTTSRVPNYPAEVKSRTAETWAKFKVVGPRAAAAHGKLSVKLRALFPVSGHVFRPGFDTFSMARRFAKSTRFRLWLVHEDGSHYDLGAHDADGLVTAKDLTLRLQPGRNLLVMLPQSTEMTDRRTFVWKYRSGRVVELVWGTPGKTPVARSPMRDTLKLLDADPFPPEAPPPKR